MTLELKKRLLAFWRAPEMEVERIATQWELGRVHEGRDKAYKVRDASERMLDIVRKQRDRGEERRIASDAISERAREYAASRIPEDVVKRLRLCDPEKVPEGCKTIFICPPDFLVPDVRVGMSPDELMMEVREVELVPIHLRFMVNHESPVPCGLVAKQIYRLILKSIGEAVGQ